MTALVQVHDTTGMASVMMTCSSSAGRRSSRQPAAADLQRRRHSRSAAITRCASHLSQAQHSYLLDCHPIDTVKGLLQQIIGTRDRGLQHL